MRASAIPYSAVELAWLEANRTMIISDYHRAFVVVFGRHDVTLQQLHSLRKRKGWKVGRREPGHYKGRRQKFSEAEITWLRDNATLTVQEYCAGFLAAHGHDMSVGAMNSLRKREGWKTGRTGHFEKGRESPTKGTRQVEGTGGRHPNSRKHHFKKGQTPHNQRGPGHEYVEKQNGYVVLIVAEQNHWKPEQKTRPVLKHKWLWEKVNGPLPNDVVLKCLDGNKLNTDPSNWAPIPRGVLPRLTGRFGLRYDQAEPEVKPVMMSIAMLKHNAQRLGKATRAGKTVA